MLNHDTWVQSGTRMGFRLDFRLEGFSLSRTGTVPSLWRHRLIKTLPCRKQRITCRPTYHYGGISFTFQDVASKIRCCAMLDPKEISLLGRGATGTLYRLNDFIAVKVSREGSDEMADHANEQSLFKKLRGFQPIPFSIRCYHQTSRSTFLELASNGSIAMLLNRYQKRTEQGTQVLQVTQALGFRDVHRWMKQLCIAAAGLETTGLCHGDIRPGNMLLDENWNLKLCDLDR